MKRNDQILAPRAPAQTPPAAAAGEITITQHVEFAPIRPEPQGAAHKQPGPGPSRPARHTLVLIGELDRRSTHTLEAEIERLCEAGIAAVTLDLTKVSGIDSAGVAVIAFRSGWCCRRGHELALIAGPRAVQRAFELAGVSKALTFIDKDPAM
jgi:anti-anti-sigma factor